MNIAWRTETGLVPKPELQTVNRSFC